MHVRYTDGLLSRISRVSDVRFTYGERLSIVDESPSIANWIIFNGSSIVLSKSSRGGLLGDRVSEDVFIGEVSKRFPLVDAE